MEDLMRYLILMVILNLFFQMMENMQLNNLVYLQVMVIGMFTQVVLEKTYLLVMILNLLPTSLQKK